MQMRVLLLEVILTVHLHQVTKEAAAPLRKREQWCKLLVIFVEFWT